MSNLGIFDIFRSKKKESVCPVCSLNVDEGIICVKCNMLVHKKCSKRFERSLICKKCYKKETKAKKKIEKAYWNIKQIGR